MSKFDKTLLSRERLTGKKTAMQKADDAAHAAQAAAEAAERLLKTNEPALQQQNAQGGQKERDKAPLKEKIQRSQGQKGQTPKGQNPKGQAPKAQAPKAQAPKGQAQKGQAQKDQAQKDQAQKQKPAAGQRKDNQGRNEKGIKNNERRKNRPENKAKMLIKPQTAPVSAAPRAQTVQLSAIADKGRAPKSKLKIIPLGGIEEIGKNLTVIEYEKDMIVVDCGIAFPDDDMPGIDLVIPDITYLINNKDRLRAIVLTHGHEDHIGALPFVLKQINVPVYGTRLTLGILKNKLEEAGILRSTKLYQAEFGDVVKFGSIAVEFIRSSHSIADAAMLAIHTPAGVLLHTGDFKIDNTPILGEPIDLARIAELGNKGVLALLSDSTNAERPGYTMSERKVGESFDGIFKNCEKRIIIATFASNIHRVQQILDAAAKYGRKVAVSGRSMVSNIQTAIELGVLSTPENVLIDIDLLNKYPPEKIVLITTGSQGETMSALYRMAYSDHRKVEIGPGDLVVISATPIPGNERLISKVINELFKLGAEVIYESLAEVHVSGHACKEEQKLIISLAKPKFFIPVHGEYRHLMKHSHTAREMGIAYENILIPRLGRVIELDNESIKLGATVNSGIVLVDGLGVGDVGNIVLRDRKHLAEDGLIIIVATLERSSRSLIAGPDIVSRGFIYVREAEEIMLQAQNVAREAFYKNEENGVKDWNAIKNSVKDAMQNYIYSATRRRPMILPIIMEI